MEWIQKISWSAREIRAQLAINPVHGMSGNIPEVILLGESSDQQVMREEEINIVAIGSKT